VAGFPPLRHLTGSFGEVTMATSYYSTVFEQPAETVWQVIRDFNSYPVWVEGAGESEIEGGRPGDAVGAVRHVVYRGRHIRQRLVAQSDIERAQTYEFADPAAAPVPNYRATIRIMPVVDGGRAFVEWWATFDCETGKRDERIEFFERSFAGWLESLRRTLARAGV
jgi:hypothetical protein